MSTLNLFNRIDAVDCLVKCFAYRLHHVNPVYRSLALMPRPGAVISALRTKNRGTLGLPKRKKPQDDEALDTYFRLVEDETGAKPSVGIILGALKQCCRLKSLEVGKKIHKDALRSGDYKNIWVANTLVDMYAKCGRLVDARQVFESMGEEKTVVSWNCMIMGYAQNGEGRLALELLNRMQSEGVCSPDRVTFLAALKACSCLAEQEVARFVDGRLLKVAAYERLKEVHSMDVRKHVLSDVAVESSLVDLYSKCGAMFEARQIFEGMSQMDVISWNSIIMGYAAAGEGKEALELYSRMGCEPNNVTYLAVIRAILSLAEKEVARLVDGKLVKTNLLETIKLVHSKAIETGHQDDKFVGSALVDAYAKSGSMPQARKLFDKLKQRDVVLWNCIILGYAQSGEGQAALDTFARMGKEAGLPPNKASFVAALKACSVVGSLEEGRRIHAQACNAGLEGDLEVATSLVDFYSKSGDMDGAERVFGLIGSPDVALWGALIAAYSHRGDLGRALELLEAMKAKRVGPDQVVFLSILTACNHAGLVDQGKKCFDMMTREYRIEARLEHYTCLVDLLGRSNQIDRAVEIVDKMPIKPNATIWLSLLGACRKWGNCDVGRLAFDSLVKIDPSNGAAYVLLAELFEGPSQEP